MKRLFAVLLIAGMVPACADSQVVRISGYVPVICHAEFVPGQPGALGTLKEFCNASRGYQVVADYAPTSDPGSIIIDGRMVSLDGSGHVVLSHSDGPRITSQNLSYVPGTTPITTLLIQLLATPI